MLLAFCCRLTNLYQENEKLRNESMKDLRRFWRQRETAAKGIKEKRTVRRLKNSQTKAKIVRWFKFGFGFWIL